jgi:transcriptional regulator with XRE-family HTH domain
MPDKRTSSTLSPHTALLGAAVRELRACRQLSQEELGFRARLHRNYVGALERGEINPTFRTLRTLAAGLDVELSSLIRLCEEREQDLCTTSAAA